MAYEPKPGSFSLFKNDKGDNANRPDYTGDGLDMVGNPIRVSAWIKEGKKGKFMSCKIQLKERDTSRREPARREPVDEPDSEIPF